MKRRTVFIGWSGPENENIAKRVSKLLRQEGFSPVVGGEWKKSFTVSLDIIHQMNGCEFAIFLIEKELRKDGETVISNGFNPNVMMEMGYMLRKVTDPNRIRRMLINVRPSEMPSDLQGFWTDEIKKEVCPSDDPQKTEQILSDTASTIANRFLEYMSSFKGLDKLDYLDGWEENRFDIYNFTGDVRISEILLYGLQAAIYTGDFDRLFKKLESVKQELAKEDQFNDHSAVACAMAILNVFVKSRRLTQGLTEIQFDELIDALDYEYENNIVDKELKAWCSIFRKDKIELCYELRARTLDSDEEKIEYYYDALELCEEVLALLNAQTADDDGSGQPKNKYYALIYKGFVYRSKANIYKALIELEPDKAQEHLQNRKKFCTENYQSRKELYAFYKNGTRENNITMDFIKQEYFLSLVEQYEFEDSIVTKKRIKSTAKMIQSEIEDRAAVHNMILQTVKRQKATFLED